MSLALLTYLVVGASFALYIGIAFLSKARSTGEFYVAGKHVHPVANGMATAADWMSAASFISLAGMIAFLGYDGAVYLMGWTGGYVLLALLLAPYLRKFGKFTVPDFIGERYYSDAARVVAVICLIAISFTYVAGQMRGVGIVFARFLNLDIGWGLLVGMGVVFFYAVLGGMKGITYTQVAQYCVLIFAYTVPAAFISLQVAGVALPHAALHADLAGGGYLLAKLDQVVGELGFTAYTSGTKSAVDVFFITLALMVGTAGLPHVIVRFFTVPKVRDARMSAGWALLFIAILYTTAPAVGAMARLNLTTTIQTGPVGSETGNLAYEERPQWFKTWEETGLLAFEDKNDDGRIQYYNDGNPAFAAEAEGHGWRGQRADGGSRHHGACESGDRQPAGLGGRVGGGWRDRRGALHRRRPAAGDFGGRLPRPLQERLRQADFRPPRTDDRPGSARQWRCCSPAISATTRPASSPKWWPSPSGSPRQRCFRPFCSASSRCASTRKAPSPAWSAASCSPSATSWPSRACSLRRSSRTRRRTGCSASPRKASAASA